MNEETNLTHSHKPNKTRFITFASLFSITAIFVLSYLWKNNSDHEKILISNRIIASKNSKLGSPLPKNFEQIVDLNILKQDALSGNKTSQQAWEIYQQRKLAKESLSLGVQTPSKVTVELDLKFLQADAEAGNPVAKHQLGLINQRQMVLKHIRLGKEASPSIIKQLNTDLLNQDAEAGHTQINKALTLLETRKKAKTLCYLGQAFSLDFYDHIDRDLLEQDAAAGNTHSKEILALADNRIIADTLTITSKPYAENFLEQVDGDLLKADADAGNNEMQYIWARFHSDGGPRKDPTITKKYYTMSAAQGNAKAQCNLGHYYNTTKSEDQNTVKAIELYTQSAKQGNALAQNNLGLLLLEESSDSSDNKEAMGWIKKAAESGNKYSQYTLGLSKCRGTNSMQKDLKLGLNWLKKSIDQEYLPGIHHFHHYVRKAYPWKEKNTLLIEVLRIGAELGDGYSMAWYGRMIIDGHGIEKDRLEGAKWIKKSCDLGNYDGQAKMADVYRHAVGVKQDFAKAVVLHKILAKKGHEVSMNNLGSIHYRGKGNVKQDLKLSAKYFQMHVDQGSDRNLIILGIMYRDGEGVEVDVEKAIKLLERAVEVNKKRAYVNLGHIYNSNTLGKKDIDKAIQYYKEGAELGEPEAQYNLAEAYLTGEGMPQDTDTAIKLYEQAAAKKSKNAQFKLGQLYETGLHGLKINLKMATELYQAAAIKGHQPAIKSLERINTK